MVYLIEKGLPNKDAFDIMECVRKGKSPAVFPEKKYEELMKNSKYRAASDECKAQLTQIQNIVHKYDPSGLVGGEAPLTKDLIRIADSDFKKVSIASILAIFLIITIVFKSVSLLSTH